MSTQSCFERWLFIAEARVTYNSYVNHSKLQSHFEDFDNAL